jgi:solute carrier family 25 S-adenosylmethionine transporter 26
MGRKGAVSAERASLPPPLSASSSPPAPRARRGAPPPVREAHVLGASRARGVASALAALQAAAQRLPGCGGGGGGAACARVRLPALRERALVGALAGCAAGAFVNGALVRSRARPPGAHTHTHAHARTTLTQQPTVAHVPSDTRPPTRPLLPSGCAQHPLDTVKVQLQVRGSPFRGPLSVVRHVLSRHGVRAGVARLYRGLPAAVLGSAASSALYFGAYEAAKEAGAPPPAAALLGNALSSVILVPKEVIKSRMQAGAPGGAAAVLASALRQRGVRGLYAGYVPTLMRNAPSNMISFSAYEGLKALATAVQRRRRRAAATGGSVTGGVVGGGLGGGSGAGATAEALPSFVTAAAGALAGALAACATHPLDLVKTRLQTQGLAPVAGRALYAGVAGTLRSVVAEEGVRGLARGLSTRLTYNALFSAVGFAAFEAAKRELLSARAAQRAAEEAAAAAVGASTRAAAPASGGRTRRS